MSSKLTFMQLLFFLYLSPMYRIGRVSFILANILLIAFALLTAAFLLAFSDHFVVFQVIFIYYCILFYPLFCLFIKRFQDIDLSPKFLTILFLLIPFIFIFSNNITLFYVVAALNVFIFLFLSIKKGNPEINKYGARSNSNAMPIISNFDIFKAVFVTIFLVFATFYIYKDIIYEKHFKQQIVLIVKNKAVLMQLKAVAEWAKVVKTDKFKKLSEEKKTISRYSFAKYVNDRVRKLEIYDDEQLRANLVKMLELMKLIESKTALEEKEAEKNIDKKPAQEKQT